MTILQDDRTPKQRKTHRLIVLGTDSFMSGWGAARNGPSFAGWACEPRHVNAVERWVNRRGDMKRVRTVIDRPGERYRPSGCVHLHIYVADI